MADLSNDSSQLQARPNLPAKWENLRVHKSQQIGIQAHKRYIFHETTSKKRHFGSLIFLCTSFPYMKTIHAPLQMFPQRWMQQAMYLQADIHTWWATIIANVHGRYMSMIDLLEAYLQTINSKQAYVYVHHTRLCLVKSFLLTNYLRSIHLLSKQQSNYVLWLPYLDHHSKQAYLYTLIQFHANTYLQIYKLLPNLSFFRNEGRTQERNNVGNI